MLYSLPKTLQTILFITLLFFHFNTQAQQIILTHKRVTDSLLHVPIQLIPADYYSKGLGFICKKEWQMEKASKVPFRFRLGSVEFVDKMEGK